MWCSKCNMENVQDGMCSDCVQDLCNTYEHIIVELYKSLIALVNDENAYIARRDIGWNFTEYSCTYCAAYSFTDKGHINHYSSCPVKIAKSLIEQYCNAYDRAVKR